jgi:hypothetical protein
MADVVYTFRSTGANDVSRDFDRISDAARRNKKTVEQATKSTTRTRSREATQQARDAERAQKKRIRDLEKAERDRKRRIKQTEDRELRDLERKLQREQRAEQKAMRDKQRAQEQHLKKQQRAEERIRSRRSARGDRFVGGVASIGRDALMAGGAAAIGVTAFAARRRMADRDAAIRLGIVGGKSGQEMLASATNTALSVKGSTTSGVLAAQEAFAAKTGDVDAAKRFSKGFAEISVATGTNIEDIGSAAADLFTKFDITSIEDMTQALSSLAVQGKRGSFELKDAATQFPKLAAAAQRFGMDKGVESLSVLGGLTQVGRGTTGSAEQAAFGLEAMFRQLTVKSEELKNKHGVRVFDKSGNTRDIRDILVETIGKVGGDDMEAKSVELTKLFGGEGMRGLSGFLQSYKDAVQNGEDGMQALRARIDEATDSAGAYSEIQRDLATAQTTTGAQLTATWERIVESVGGSLEPALLNFVGTLESLPLENIGHTLGFFAEAVAVATDTLQNWGLLAKKSKDNRPPEQQIAEAKEKLATNSLIRADLMRSMKFDATDPGEQLTLMRQAKQLQKLGEEDLAAQRVLIEQTGRRDRLSEARNTPLSREQFMERYAAADEVGGEPGTLAGAGLKARAERAYQAAIAGPEQQGGIMLGIDESIESEEQKALRQGLYDTVARNATRTDGAPEGAARGEDMQRLGAVSEKHEQAAASLLEAAEVLKSSGGGSFFSAFVD